MITVYGYSDDLVEMEGHPQMTDEFGGETALIFGNKDFGGVRIEMRYAGPGVWAATIQQLDEGVPIPWDIRVKHAMDSYHMNRPGYTVLVEIDIPEDKVAEVAFDHQSLEGLDD